MAKKDGVCYASFRGSNLPWTDWDASDFGRAWVCAQDDEGASPEEDLGSGSNARGNCCSTRMGFSKAYNTTYHRDIQDAVRRCAKGCPWHADECVVLSGHSQGGAMAAMAALVLADLNPHIITFGQPGTIDAPCSMLSRERLFRFVNTKASKNDGLIYDPIPFIQGLGADDFGYMVFLGDDSTGVASIVLGDRGDQFRPASPFGLEAHSMLESNLVPGYLDRLQSLQDHSAGSVVRSNGFANGAFCSESVECLSELCEWDNSSQNFRRCKPALCSQPSQCPLNYDCWMGECQPRNQSCMACEKDLECSSGRCFDGVCAGSNGLMDTNCGCKEDAQCSSRRCRDGVCEARLPIGSSCEESGDCYSGACSLESLCKDPGQPNTIDFGMANAVPQWSRINWGALVVVMFGCMVVTFTLVKRVLYSRKKDYSSIPSDYQV